MSTINTEVLDRLRAERDALIEENKQLIARVAELEAALETSDLMLDDTAPPC